MVDVAMAFDRCPAAKVSAVRVLMTADPGSTTWNFVIDLVAGLGEQGVETVLATLGTRLYPGQRREVRALPNVMLAESDFKVEWMPSPWDDVSAAGDWLLGLVSRYGIEIAHCNHLAHGNLRWGIPVLTVGHACVLSWWNSLHRTVGESMDRYVAEVSASLQGADAVIAPSRAMLGCLEGNYGPLVDGAVIHSARRPMPHTSVRKESHIFAAGRLWDESKNLAVLGRIARNLPWPVHVAGANLSPGGFDASIPHVDLLGALSTRALSSWYRRSAIFVLPAKYEPTGLTVLDAARAGCAIVVSDIPSLRELWDGAALFVPPDDDHALTAALVSLTADAELRARYARAARQRASEYSHERCVQEYLLAYRVLRGGYERLYDGVREVPQQALKLGLPATG